MSGTITYVPFTLSVPQPATLVAGAQTITANLNIITIGNPGPENINTAYNGLGYFSYIPPTISTLQFNNAGPPPVFVAATTAHGSATLVTSSTNPPRALLTIGLYNYDAQAAKLFQINDTAAPGLLSGQALQSAQVSYAVLASGAVGTAVTLVRPTLPTTAWMCWRGNSNPIHTTDPDVVVATIDTTNLVVKATVTIDDPGSSATLYTSTDGTTWTPQFTMTPTGGTALGITTPTTQSQAVTFAVQGTVSGYATAPTLQYRDDSGTYVALPSGATVSTTAFSFTHPSGLAVGAHTISVRDANNTAVTVTTGNFNITAPVTPTISVATPSQPSASAAFTMSGVLTGYNSAPTLTYADDGAGVPTALPAGATVTTTAFSFSHPGLAAGNHTTVISDGTQTGSTAYTVAAVQGGPSPDKSTVTNTTGSLTDNGGNRYTISSGAQVAINGLVGTATTVAGLSGISNITNTVSGSTYTYSDTLLNNGSVPIATYWFAWQPGQNYLPSLPTPAAPSGWTFTVSGAAGGYGIEWVTATPLQPGQSVTFGFSTADTPAILFGPAASFPSVTVATATIEGTSTSSGNSITVPASLPQQTASQIFYVQAAFNYVPVKGANLQYSANSSGVVFGPFSANTGITWDSTGTIATIPISSGTQAIHYFQVEDTGTTPTTISAELTYQVGTTGGGGTYTAVAASGTPASALVVSSNNQPQTLSPTTANVVEIAWVGGQMWYENTSNLWFYETSPLGPWLPVGGTLVSPLASAAAISVNQPSVPQANTAFTITGTLTNYTAIPTLVYDDNGGPAQAFPSGSSVTLTSFSFSHPGLAAGNYTLVVTDGVATATVSYSIAASSWTTLPSQAGLEETISGLLPGVSYDIEVYAINSVGQGPASAILTVSTTQTVVTAVGIPTGLVSAGATTTGVNLVWLPPSGGATPTGYNTRYSPTGLNTWTAGPTVTVSNAQITGLSSGTTYDFEVQAFNSSGSGTYSSLTTVSTASAAPSVVSWQPSGASSTITLSNSNLTATAGGSSTVGSTRQGVVSTQSITNTKASFEVTLSGVSDSVSLGLTNSTFQFSTQLGNDVNSIGYFPCNIPAVTQTESVSGLPLWGVGVNLSYPSAGSGSVGADAVWVWFAQNFCTPRTCLQYPGAFDTQGNITYYTQSYINGWKQDLYWNGTTAAVPGIATRPCIPIGGIPLTTLDGTVTFATAAAHQNTAYFNNFIDMWLAAGFKKIAVRLCWEDNYPTTPAGQDASPGSNFPATTSGKASYAPWTFYGGGTAYANAFILAWRAVAYDMKQHAAAVGMDLTMVWGPTIINSDSIDWRDSYPDSVQTDGHGKLVDCLGPDFYWGNFWGDTTNLRSNYNNQAPFTTGTVTATGATQAQFGADTGSKCYWSDWTDGYKAPPATPTTPLGYQGGMSMYETFVFALQNNIPVMWCEFGGLDATDGGTNPKGNQNNGLSNTGSATWANEPGLAAYTRSRIAWFQNKSQNGIANGTFLQFSFWRGQGQAMLNAFAAEFPELVANPDAGSAGVGSGTSVTTQAAIVPQTIRTGGTSVTVPSGNSPAADTAGATISVCVDTTVSPSLFWVTSPAMRAAYGSAAWNDSATANPGTGVGGIPFTLSGALSICFSTGESGGVAVLNAGSGAFSFSGIPSNFPPWHGATPVVTAPGQVTALAAAQLQYAIAVPSSIPVQQTGTFFSVQAAFNYVPNQANLYYTPPDASPTTTVGSTTVTAFSTGLSNNGTITWDSTGTIATFKFFFNTATNWSFQIFDTTAGINTQSAAVTFVTQAAAASGGGGTSTATAIAPSTAVNLSWAAPSTGSGPFTYVVMQSPTGAATYSAVGTTTSTSISLQGINQGIAYDYVVYAANGAGDGSNSSLVTYTVPGSPQSPSAATGLTAGTTTTTSVALSWQPPSSGPTVTGYQVQYKVASQSTYLNYASTTPGTSQVITGLTSGTTYNFQVIAFNSVGNATPSTPAVSATTQSTVTPPPSNTPAQTLLAKIGSTIQGVGVISGEYIGTGPITPINTIQTTDGQWLGLIGGDYWAPTGTGAAVTTFNANAISYWNAGGICTLSLSMPNPTTGGVCTDVSNLTVADLLTTGTATNTSLINMLNQVVTGLQALQTAGVVVILRPFYRSNAADFWWGTQFLTAAQYVSLWQYTYNYLVNSQGLQNILFLWTAQSPFSNSTQTAARYPGNGYVDMTGLDLFTSTTTSVAPTDVITVSSIPNPTNGQTFSLTGTGTLAWTSSADVQISVGATKSFVSAQSAGYSVVLSASNTVAVVSGIPAPAAGSYTAYMEDSGTGIQSAGVAFTVNAAPATGGATSVPGVPYLGFGMELAYPGDGYFVGTQDLASVAIGNFTQAFCKPTNMLMYAGSFASPGSLNYGVNGYLSTWNNYPAFNKTNLGFNLIPILGLSLTTTDGTMTFASIISGSVDSQIQSYLQTCLTAGYKTVVFRIGYEDNLPTTPGGQSAGSSQFGAAAVTNGGAAWGYYGAESEISYSTTIAGLPTGQATFCDAYIKAWRRFAHVVQQFALANGMTVWKCWGPCILNSAWFDPRLMYPDTASYQAADGWGKLVDNHAPDLYFANPYIVDTTHLKAGYQNNAASAPFNGNYATSGTAANVTAFLADPGSSCYSADFRSGAGASLQNAYNANPNAKLPWSGGWGVFESMVWALQCGCSWGVPEGFATESYAQSYSLNGGTTLYGAPGYPAGTDFPNIPEVASYLRKRILWFQNESYNGIANGVVLWISMWGSSAGMEMLADFATSFPEVATNSGNNPLAGEAGVAFPTPN
jgi:hypothetical protein